MFRLRCEGRKNFPEDEGAIIVSNHQSYLDPIFIGVVSPKKTYYFARSDLFKIPLFGNLIKFLGTAPIQRGVSDLSAARQGISMLSEKKFVVIFPEGTRTRNGEIGKIYTGSLIIAKKTNSKILPCYIDGSFKVLPRNKKIVDLRDVKVFVGKPFYLDKNTKSSYIEKTLLEKFMELKTKKGEI